MKYLLKIFRYFVTYLFLSFLLISINHNTSNLYAQIVFVPTEDGMYEFLERMSLKGLIKIDDEVKPFSRKYIATNLLNIKNSLIKNNHSISQVELDEMMFYEEEFFYELNQLLKNDTIYSDEELMSNRKTNTERWYLFSYSDSQFNTNFSPIAGYGLSSSGNKSGHTRWVGLSTFGTYSDWFGFSFDIRDKGEFGDNVDRDKYFSPLRGAWYKGAPDGIEYSDAKGSINFNWSWGQVSLIKDYMQWGHAKFGQLILSDKAPSYPQIRFQIKPVEWLRFSYMHGWLSSLVYDSANFYNSYPGTISEATVKGYIPKFIAANMVTVSPIYWLDFSVGNAVVYGGQLRPEFFIPFMFYKFLDHNTGRGDVNDANGMMYFDFSVKYPKNFQFYGTIFIDVTEIRNILDNNFNNTWTGFSLGGKTIDLLMENLDLTIEYTRVNPWVYEHKNDVTNFKHLKYSLGHWLGQNSDQFRIQFNYQLIRGLKFDLFIESIRKGGLDEIYYAYKGMDEKDFPFLYPPIRKEKRIGFDFSYEYLHDLIIKGNYTYSDIADENLNRDPVFFIGNKNSASITLFYGI